MEKHYLKLHSKRKEKSTNTRIHTWILVSDWSSKARFHDRIWIMMLLGYFIAFYVVDFVLTNIFWDILKLLLCVLKGEMNSFQEIPFIQRYYQDTNHISTHKVMEKEKSKSYLQFWHPE